MTGSLVFVHGTGNWDGRREGLDRGLDHLADRVRAAMDQNGLSDVVLHVPPWGRECGPRWPDITLTLPPAQSTKSAAAAAEADDIAIWELLAFDPLVELRLAALAAPAEQLILPGVQPPDALLSELLRTATLDHGPLDAAGIRNDVFARAIAQVADSDELAGAARVAGRATPELLDMAARAVVAQLFAEGRTEDLPPQFVFDAAARDALLAATRSALAEGSYKGLVPAAVRTALAGLAARVGTAWAVPRRGKWMDPVTSFGADIVFYLQHGKEVRSYLRRQLELAEERAPVVVIGHSLGGVALVDLLSSDADRPDVALLVTVGSQAPYLYQLDALAYLRPDRLHRPFTPWLNLYDRRDLLAFCAERVFPGDGVTDILVDTNVPFPEAHSAYWEAPQVWQEVTKAWPR